MGATLLRQQAVDLCVCVSGEELKNNNKTDENSVCFLLFHALTVPNVYSDKILLLIGADFSNVSSSHPWYNTGINKHQVGRL